MKESGDLSFADIVGYVSACGDAVPPVIIGGQAVNYWCARAVAFDSELKALVGRLGPTSEDVDMVADNPGQVLRVALQSNLKAVAAKDFNTGTNQAALVDGQGKTRMQFLGAPFGLKLDEFRRSITNVDHIDEATGQVSRFRVLALVPLLKSKLALVVSPTGARSDRGRRRDQRHVKLLLKAFRGNTRQSLLGLYAGSGVTERKLIEDVKEFLDLARWRKEDFEKAAKMIEGLSLRSALPAELFSVPETYPKVSAFIKSPQFLANVSSLEEFDEKFYRTQISTIMPKSGRISDFDFSRLGNH